MDQLKPDQHVTHDDGTTTLKYYEDVVQSGDTSDLIKTDVNPVLTEGAENKVHSKVHEDTIFKDQNDLENAQHTETIAPDTIVTDKPFEVSTIVGDTHHEETESGVNQMAENVIRDNRPYETANILEDSHQEHINPSTDSVKEDTHTESTEGATEVIKEGRSSDGVHETESIARGITPEFLPTHTESISETSHEIKSESGTDQIHENAKSLAEQMHTAGTGDLQIAQDTIRHDVTEITEEIKSDTTVKVLTEHTDTIKHGETPEVVQSTENIADGTSGSTEHQTEMISDGTKSDSIHQTETIADNANSEMPESSVDSIATDAHEELTEASTQSIAENTQGSSTEGSTAEMASDAHEEVSESELAPISSDTHEEVTESELAEVKSADVGNTDYNQPTISDPNSVDARYQNFEHDTSVEDIKPDTIVDDSPIDTTLTIAEGTQGDGVGETASIADDSHQESTEGTTELIKDGTSGDSEHATEQVSEDAHSEQTEGTTLTIAEDSAEHQTEYSDPEVKSDQHEEITEGETSLINEGTSGDTEHETEQVATDSHEEVTEGNTESIHEGTAGESEHELEMIHEGTQGDSEHEIEQVHENTQDLVTEGETEMIDDGTSGDSEHQTETVADNAHELTTEGETESIHEGVTGDSEHELEMVSDNSHELTTEGDTELVKDGINPEVDQQLLNIGADAHEEESEFNQPTIDDQAAVDQIYQSGTTLDGGTETLAPDQIINDNPIDEVRVIMDGTQGDSTYEDPQVLEDKHEEVTEGETEGVKEGTQGPSDHETEMIAEGEVGDSTYTDPEVLADTHEEVTEGDTLNVKDGVEGESNYEDPNIHEDAHSEETEGETEMVHEGDEGESDYEDPNIHEDNHEEITEGETEEVKSGTSSDTTYEDPQVKSDTHEEVKEGDTESIKSGETGDSEYQTESIKSGEVGDSDYQTLNIAEGEVGDSDYETEQMKGEDAEEAEHETEQINAESNIADDYSKFSHIDAGTEEIKPDKVTDDSPIDAVEVIEADAHELTTEGETEAIKSGTEGTYTESTELIKGTPIEIGYDRDYSGTGTTRGDWSQVPFVGDVIGLATSAYNGVLDDVNALMHDKRYQVYLATQALGDVLVDRIYGTGMMSPTQMLAFANMLKNTFTVKNAVEALVGGLVSLIKGKGFHFDIGPINIPKRGLPIDQLDGPLIYKLATQMGGDNANVTRFKMEMDKLVMDDPPSIGNPTSMKKLQSNYVKTITSEFYKEFKKVVIDPVKDDGSYSLETKVEDLKYWDGTNMAATKKYDAPFKGRKSLMGFSLDSSHLWDIAIFPYKGAENGNKTELPNTPTQNKADGSDAWIPALSYSFSDYKMESKVIPTALGFSEMNIPIARTQTQEFSMMIVDDQYGHWGDYLHKVSKATATIDGLEVVPYKNVTFQLNLFILDVGAHIRYYRKLLVVLKDWEKQHTGEEDPAVVTYNLSFQIVGEITQDNKDEQNI